MQTAQVRVNRLGAQPAFCACGPPTSTFFFASSVGSEGAAALPILRHVALALDCPTQSVHGIIGAALGSAADILAGFMGAWLSERLGQQFVVESDSGAGGYTGIEAVVRAAPDGYTLRPREFRRYQCDPLLRANRTLGRVF